MGRADLKAKIRLEGDAKGATTAIKKTESGFKRLTKTIKTSALAQVAAFAGVAVALRGLVRGIGSSITAANAQADAINALEGALAPLGDQVDSVSKSLQAQAAALQKVTTFGDETIIEAQAMLASFVKEEDAIKAATQATLDLAEAKKFDLVAAADLVSKTLGSSTNALTRYGIEVTGAVGSSERLTSLTENIAKVFGGRATKATETFSGKVKQLGNAWGDLAEDVGEAITNNEDASKSIDDLTKSVEEVAPAVAKFAVAFLKVVTAVGSATAAIFEFQAKIQTFIPNLIRVKVAASESAVSMDAMAASAAGQGISVEELQSKIDASIESNHKLAASTKEAGAAMDSAADGTERLANEQARLKAEAAESATAMEKLGTALGIVTAAQLESEIVAIEKALTAARDATKGFSQELIDAEAEGGRQMASLELRAEGLRDGIGDIGKEAADAALGFDKLGDAIDDTGDAAEETGENFDGLTKSVRDTNTALADQSRQARATRGELIQLTAVAESLALAEARTQLAITQAKRKRVTGTKGSREIDYNLSEFGTGGRATVEPNGTLRPA